MKKFSYSTGTAIKALVRQNLYAQALKSSISFPAPNLTLIDTLYSIFIKSGLELDPFLSASLISHSSLSLPTSAAFFSRAIHFLSDTLYPDVVVFNSILSGLARFGQSGHQFLVFNRLREKTLKPDVYTLSSLVKGCDEIKRNEMVHGVSIKLGFVKNVFLVSGLVENYSKIGSLMSAERSFEDYWCLDSVVWTAMVKGYVCNGKFDEAKDVFKEMGKLGMELNQFTLTTVLSGVCEVEDGQQIHGFSLKIGYLDGSSICLSNAVMCMYSRVGCWIDAIKVFEENPDPDVVSWAERIAMAYDGVEAMELFHFCVSRNLVVNEYTIINVLSKIEGNDMLKVGKQVHLHCYKNGYLSVVSVSNALISMYGNVGGMEAAQRVFGEMIFQDSVSWNALITAYVDNGLAGKVVCLFSQMRKLALEPSEYTMASILDAVSCSNSLGLTMQVHSLLIKYGFVSDNSILSCLLIAYGDCREIDYSKKVFDEIDHVDVKYWHAMACALGRTGNYINILEQFRSRWGSHSETDNVTFSIALKACGVLTEMEQARTIHSLALKSGIDVDYFVESAIIDVYCKCGNLADAEKIFRRVGRYNLVAWNAMIVGYAQCGFHHEVFDLFSRMCEFGPKPDEITYLAILTLCCHAGLVDEAHYHLNSMFELHRVIPKLEHHACVVNLLGRVGLLEDAMSTIDGMPMQPDAQIWQSLLSACCTHNNIDVGKVAARKLLELQPENDSAFILLSNLYASAGIWNEAGELRREMEENVVHKKPGYSWIQVV